MKVQPVFDFSSRPNVGRMPAWIRQAFGSEDYAQTSRTLAENTLTTVCEEARCPNRGECWSRGTATFMLLGDTCTRACGFCAVKTGRPDAVEQDEPQRVANAVASMNLDYIVLTSVNRDDQMDGGAGIFAETLLALRAHNADIKLELLTPDFHGCQAQAIAKIITAMQQATGDNFLVWGHNVETVPHLYRRVRKGSSYARSLELLAAVSDNDTVEAKSALMLGLGEKQDDVITVLKDLRRAGVRRIALGQYLRPSRFHLAVEEYVSPEQFSEYESIAHDLGFSWVKSGPLVRSSYHADD
ncbi:Lipoyl synthase [hydrothermal vent metagenome]|uniref:lipoyl synthase n=1 Tax=hydrothermal vent metagenome TaxID=652676 RepID=A0A3B0ZL18_9ZZZZ